MAKRMEVDIHWQLLLVKANVPSLVLVSGRLVWQNFRSVSAKTAPRVLGLVCVVYASLARYASLRAIGKPLVLQKKGLHAWPHLPPSVLVAT